MIVDVNMDFIDKKVENWDNGMNCSNSDKRVVVEWCISRIRELVKDVEYLKKVSDERGIE